MKITSHYSFHVCYKKRTDVVCINCKNTYCYLVGILDILVHVTSDGLKDFALHSVFSLQIIFYF